MSKRAAFQQLGVKYLPALFMLLLLIAGGCGYMVGGVHEPTIRSVHVPTFTTEAYRRGLELQLTEAVQKQIKSRSHFRLAKEPDADTRLTGRIVGIRKQVLGESRFDDPRELQMQFQVEVSWQDLRSGRILAEQTIPIAPEAVHLVSEASFAPEIGQSLATGTQEAIETMARSVVEMMETPW
jgi:hypothetical protein